MHERSPTASSNDATVLSNDDNDGTRTGTHAYADLEVLSLGTRTSPSTPPSTSSSTSSLRKLQKNPNSNDCTELEDFYREYDPTRAKQLIDALPLPRHEICSKCAKLDESPVYSDRFFYNGRPLLAKEKLVKSSSLDKNAVDFMPVHKIVKSNAASIFYSIGPSQDAIDLKASLEPSILLLEEPSSTMEARKTTKRKSRAHLHLPLPDRGYNRVSEKLGIVEPMRLPILTSDSQHIYEQENSCKVNIDEEPEAELDENRSSLLMLEPLLLVSSRAMITTAIDRRREVISKKQIAHLEHLKLIKIVIAYTATFLLLVSITFYVVYFA